MSCRQLLRPVHDAHRAAERRGAAQFGAVPRLSRTCGGAPPSAAMPRRAAPIGSSSIFAARCSAAEVALGLRTWIQPIGKYYKIMCRFLSGNPITVRLCIVNRARRRGAGGAAAVAARCHAAQPRRVHREPALTLRINTAFTLAPLTVPARFGPLWLSSVNVTVSCRTVLIRFGSVRFASVNKTGPEPG